MSDLTGMEKRKLERLFGMASGYVLNFSNQTFYNFVLDSTGRDIYDAKYDYSSGSKANRLRAFWNEEPNQTVSKLLNDLIEYGRDIEQLSDETLVEQCHKIVVRLAQNSPVMDFDALTTTIEERDFEVVAKAVRDAIEKNEPEVGLYHFAIAIVH